MANLLVSGKPFIQKPTDPELLAKLQEKFSEYTRRMFKVAGLRGNFCDVTYKNIILSAVLEAPEGGKVLQTDVETRTSNVMINGPMQVRTGEHAELFKNAWAVIHGYVHDPVHFPLVVTLE